DSVLTYWFYFSQATLQLDTFDQLSRLAHLNELRLTRVLFDLATLEHANPIPIRSVRKLKLNFIRFSKNLLNSVIFCRIIASFFPKMEQISLDLSDMVKNATFPCGASAFVIESPY